MFDDDRFRDTSRRFLIFLDAFQMRPVLSFARHVGVFWLKASLIKKVWIQTKAILSYFFSPMSGRLASFRGPSTPNSSPAQHKAPSIPPSPSRLTESTFHRKTRTLLQELRSITQTWDDLVLIDGLKAARELVDTRTDLEYFRCSVNRPILKSAFQQCVEVTS